MAFNYDQISRNCSLKSNDLGTKNEAREWRDRRRRERRRKGEGRMQGGGRRRDDRMREE